MDKSHREQVYRTIVEGKTEYVLIPRNILQGEYKLVAAEQLTKDQKTIDKLLDQNEKLMALLEAKPSGVQKTK
jgi:hypothetical protein